MMLRHVGYTAHADKLESLIELANNSLNMSGDGKEIPLQSLQILSMTGVKQF